MRLDPFPVPKLEYQDMDLRGQIWRYSPDRKIWELAFRSPLVDVKGDQVPLAINFRNMAVFQGKSDPAPALYTVPTQGLKRAREVMLRSYDGQHFEELPQPILPGEYGKWRSFRGLVSFKGRLFTSPSARQDNYAVAADQPDQYQACGTAANIAAETSVRCSDDPGSGKWEQSSPPDLGDLTNWNIYDMAVCGDHLYLGTLNVREGFQLWRTDGEGPGPHHWQKVLDLGADRGPFNQMIMCLAEFRGDLYLGTGIQNGGHDKFNNIGPAGAEIIRVHPDGTWDLVVGEPRRTRQGFKVPTSGLGPGFGMLMNGYMWRMTVHDDVLYVGTAKVISMMAYTDRNRWPDFARRILDPATMDHFLAFRGAAELWRTCDGDNWTPITINGFDNRYNIGVRSLLSTPKGLFVGTTNLFGPKVAIRYPGGWRYEDNPRGGVEVWHGSYAHHGDPQPDRIKQVIRTTAHDSTTSEPGGGAAESCDETDLSAPTLFDDEAFGAEMSVEAVSTALCCAELLDPLGRMALLDSDLDLPGDTVDDELNRYFQGAGVRNVGYWHDEDRTPKKAACRLIRELVSMAFGRGREPQVTSSLVIGADAGAVASELLRLHEHAQVTVLVFDAASAEQARRGEPRANVVWSRRGKFKLPDRRFDFVLWVEGPSQQDRVRALREVHRVLRPGGCFAASDILVRQARPGLERGADIVTAYENNLREAGLVDVKVPEVSDKTWRPFFDHSRTCFRARRFFDEIDDDRYQKILAALPGGDQAVDAYVMVFAAKHGKD